MDLITLDFETYYDEEYSLKKLTTEEYVRDPRFETILVSYKVNNGPSFFVPKNQVAEHLARLEPHKHAVVCHHAHFDCLILSHHYGIKPGRIFDTLSMARALHGANGRLSLAKLAERYGVQAKGDEVHNVMGMHFADFDHAALKRYGTYGCGDTDITHAIFHAMIGNFIPTELENIDRVVRMFTEPLLELDVKMLEEYAKQLQLEKTTLLLRSGTQVADLMSNEKFAQALREVGVEPPTKISPKTKKVTWAFAKTDPGMQALQEHPDEMVQVLVEARLKNKSTLAETRAQRLIGMAGRGATCIYLKPYGAVSHRLTAGDKTQFHNLPRGGTLRKAIKAPQGYVCVVGDSSNIEARLLDWLAKQDDMVEVYRRADRKEGPDIYCVVAERIYKRAISKKDDPQERQMGKIAKLGLGYGMGADKFVISVRKDGKDEDGKPLVISKKFSQTVVDIYRGSHPKIAGKEGLWRRAEKALEAILKGVVGFAVDPRGIVTTVKDGVILPNGLKILFPDLQWDGNAGQYGEFTFWNGKKREHIYGAKLVENITQALAKLVVFEQCRKAAREIGNWVHSVHDEGVFVVHEFEAPWALERLLWHMRQPLPWCLDLPLNSEGGFHVRYGEAK